MTERLAFSREQDVELGGRNLVAFQKGPGVGVGVGCIDLTQEARGKSTGGFIASKGVEGALEDDPAEIPKDGKRGLRGVRIHRGATVFTLFPTLSTLI